MVDNALKEVIIIIIIIIALPRGLSLLLTL